MKQLILTVLFLIYFPNSSFSQPTWTEQNSGVTVTLTSVHSANGAVWVCGYSGTVLRSINSGVTWLNVSGNGIPPATQLINVVAIGINTALVAGYVGTNTFVYRTSNSGANWTQVFTEASGFINAINIKPNGTNGFMMGDPVGTRWSLWKTTNGGITWDSSGCYLPRTGTTEAGWNNSLFGINDRLWFGTNNTKIYHSTDYGSSWTAQSTTGEVNSYALWFEALSSEQNGFSGGTTMLKTTNYGNTWNPNNTLGTGNIGGITAGPYIITDNVRSIPPYLFYVRPTTNKIYYSTNGGTSWAEQYTAPAGNYRYIGTSFFANGIWAVRDNGGISFLDIGTKVTQTGTEVPELYSLSQNYPNPFNPVTNIKFSVPKDGNVSIKVFDVYGKETGEYVNEFLSRGEYKVSFDGTGLSSGIYFCVMKADNFTDKKKMILVK
ncbi:MAG: YCF48-related protein [bacterium]|nr:YCF48-related protein [bacterium]